MAIVAVVVLFFAAEVAAAVEVALHVGVFTTVALLVFVSACGPLVLRQAGLTMWHQARVRLSRGELPGKELRDGALKVVAGLLLCLPGFLSGVAGGLLLLPPVRSAVGRVAGRWIVGRRLPGVVAVRSRSRSAGGVDWPADQPGIQAHSADQHGIQPRPADPAGGADPARPADQDNDS